MEKKVYAVSQKHFEQILSTRKLTDENIVEQNTAFIQIKNTFDDNQSNYEFKLKDTKNVLSLKFDDCDEEIKHEIIGTIEYISAIPMSEEQGKQILDFINKNKDKETFLIHCHAGISRSGGVSKFISEYFGLTEQEYRNMNPSCRPNQRIINILRKLNYSTNLSSNDEDEILESK